MSADWLTIGKGQSVLWFPGFMEPRARISDLASELSTRYHVTVVSMPPRSAPEQIWEAVRRHMTAYSIARAHVLGTSDGTRASMDFVIHRSHYVSSVYLVSPWIEPDRKASDTVASWNAAVESSMETKHLVHMILSSMCSASTHEDGMIDRLCAEYLDQYADPELAHADLAAGLAGLLEGAPRLKDLWRAMPTVVAGGREDQILGERHARRIWARVPLSMQETFESAGHLAHIEQPSRFASSVQRFWDLQATLRAATLVAP